MVVPLKTKSVSHRIFHEPLARVNRTRYCAYVEQIEQGAASPHQVIADRVKSLRKKRGWSAERLAEEMTAAGIPWTRVVVTKLETARRPGVNVAELFGLAYALGVSPVHLVVDPDDDSQYRVTATCSAPAADVRAWVRGFKPIGDTDARTFFTAVPSAEFGKREEHPERDQWVRDVVGYLTRSMGRLYRRDDGTTVFELEMPRKVGGRGQR
jgi:transcriptional regulator with XRE-family HTH domain